MLLILQLDVRWFALATSVDYLIVAVCLLLAYRKYNGPRFGFSVQKAKYLLKRGAPYILSGMMVAIYAQTDKLMLKQMLDETAVGYYSTATTICGMWVFVLQAIIDSMYPTIMRLNGQDEQLFKRKNRQLYAIVFYVSIFVSFVFAIFGELIVQILYGKAFLPAANPLRIIAWYTAFSYLGVARDAWIVSKNKQKYLFYIYFTAAILNVGLNIVFIPILGTAGAALASLVTQIVTSIIFPLFIKPLRPNAKLMLEAIFFKDVFNRRNETK